MKRTLTLLLLLGVLAHAQVSPALVQQALDRSSTLSFARSDLEDAQGRFERLRADGLSTRREVLDAEIALDTARRAVLAARLEVRADLTRDLLAWQEARANLQLGRLRQQLAAQNARAADLRLRAGAINAIEHARVQGEARGAEADTRRLEAVLAGSAGALVRRLGAVPAGETLPGPAPRPDRQALAAALEEHPRVAEARAALERARFDLALRDNEFNPRLERTQARQAVTGAEKRLADARTGVRSALDASWAGYTAAREALPGAERAVAQAGEELAAQRARLARGTVSQLQVLQSQIALEAARASLGEARNRLTLAVVDLAVTAQVEVWPGR